MFISKSSPRARLAQWPLGEDVLESRCRHVDVAGALVSARWSTRDSRIRTFPGDARQSASINCLPVNVFHTQILLQLGSNRRRCDRAASAPSTSDKLSRVMRDTTGIAAPGQMKKVGEEVSLHPSLQHQSYSNSWAAVRGLDFAYGTFRTDRRINGAVIMNERLLNKAEHTPIAWRIAGMGE